MVPVMAVKVPDTAMPGAVAVATVLRRGSQGHGCQHGHRRCQSPSQNRFHTYTFESIAQENYFADAQEPH